MWRIQLRKYPFLTLLIFIVFPVLIFYAGNPADAADLSAKRRAAYKLASQQFWGDRNELGNVDCDPVDVRIISGNYGTGEYGHAWLYGAYKNAPNGVSAPPENYCRVFINNQVRQDSRQTCLTFMHLYGHLLGKDNSNDINSPMYTGYANSSISSTARARLYNRFRKILLGKSLCKNLTFPTYADDDPAQHPYDLWDFGEDDNDDPPGASIASSGNGPGGQIFDPGDPIPDLVNRSSQAVRIAKGELGTKERPMGSNCTPGNKYHNNCVVWCAFFVTWVWQQAGINVPTIGATNGIETWGKAHGRFHSVNSSYDPQPGDAAIFGTGHVGMVTSVEGGKIRIISGNYSNRVQRHRSNRGLNLDYPKNFYGNGFQLSGFVSPE